MPGRTGSQAKNRLMEPPLKSKFPGLAPPLLLARSGGSLFVPRRCAPWIGHCWAETHRRHAFGRCVNSLSRRFGRRVQVAPCSTAFRRRSRFAPTQGSRQSASLTWRPLSLALPFVGPARHRQGRFPAASGFGRCRLSRVSGNAHKPLTLQEETHHGEPQTR